MTQLFKPNEDNARLFEVMKNAKASNISHDMINMHSEIIGSKALGGIIFDNGFVDLGFEVDRKFFVENYISILDAMTRPITFDAYTILIKSMLGDSVEVEFTIPNPGHLIVNITEVTYDFGLMTPDGIGLTAMSTSSLGNGWAVRPDSGLITRSGNGFSFRSVANVGIRISSAISTYTIEQARNVLENLVTGGVFTEYNFTVGN